MLRLYTTRQLEIAQAHGGYDARTRRLLEIPTERVVIVRCLRDYGSLKDRLSYRGQVEYGILLAESRQFREADAVFSRVASAAGEPLLPQAQLETVRKAAGWLRENPSLARYAPSNKQKWIDAARVLAGAYAVSGTNDLRTLDYTQALVVLEPAWRLPLLIERTSIERGSSSALPSTLQARIATLSALRWGVLIVAVFLTVTCWPAFQRSSPKALAFEYLGCWGVIPGLSTLVRGWFYRYALSLIITGISFAAFSYWFARTVILVMWELFLPCYGLSRLMPSLRLITRGLMLTCGALKRRAVLGMTGLLWLLKFCLPYTLAWISHWTSLVSRYTDVLRPGMCLNPSVISVAIMALMTVLIAPLGEEIIFRGLLYTSLRKRLGLGLAAVVSATIFAFIHHYSWLGSTMVFVDGVAWVYAFEYTGSLLPGILVHALGNLFWFLRVYFLYRPVI